MGDTADRRQQRRGLWAGGLGAALAVLCAWGGCSRAPTQSPPVSPRETVAALIGARQAGRYQEIRQSTVPQHAQDVVVTLTAVDGFLAANRELCALVQAEVGLGLAQTIDQSHRAYYLDIFSKYVELLDETVEGPSATVAYVVDGRLPARHTRLQMVDGRWCYDPGPGDYRQLAGAFDQMAHGLRRVSEGINTGRLPPAELRENPDRLVEEVRLRLLPGVKLLPRPAEP